MIYGGSEAGYGHWRTNVIFLSPKITLVRLYDERHHAELRHARRVILEDAEGRLRSGGPRPLAHNGQAAIEALIRLEYTTKITIEGEPDDTEDKPVKPAGGKRGRQARRITCRHGDETHTFPSAAKAAEWLRDDRQRPKASAAAIYAAISQNRTYAGYQWAYAHDNQPNVSRMV